MKKIAITTKHHLKAKKKILVDLINCIQKHGKEVYLSENAFKNLPEKITGIQKYDFNQKVDLIFVIGGDGAVLRTVRKLKYLSTPICGINAGRLGFLSEVQPADIKKTCQHLLEKNFVEDKRMLLDVQIIRNKKIVKQFRALNEVVISHGTVARLIELPTYIINIPIANFRSDGLIVATPTGSTAHSLSAGGPIIHPKVEAIILTPISPHSFTQKPIVIPANKSIVVEPKHLGQEKAAITIDGQVGEILKPKDQVKITKFKGTAKLLRMRDEHYFQTLRNKLGWGGGFNGECVDS